MYETLSPCVAACSLEADGIHGYPYSAEVQVTPTTSANGVMLLSLEAVPKRDGRYGRAEIAVSRWLDSDRQEVACEEGQFGFRSLRLALKPRKAGPSEADAQIVDERRVVPVIPGRVTSL
jgi:hypothetical protein